MFSTPTKLKVFICNMIICALCILSIVSYFFLPFWKVEATYTLRAEMLETMLPSPEDPEEPAPVSDSSEEPSPEDIYAQIDLTEIVPEEGIAIPLSIEFQTSDILSSLTSDATALVHTILQKNVDTIINKLESTIDELAEEATALVVKNTFKAELKNQVKEKMGEDAADADVEQKLNDLGLTDEHIDTQTDKLVDALYAEDASVDSVTDKTVEIIKESLSEANSKGVEGYEDLELSPEAEEDLREQLSETFQNFADEDGKINPTDAIMDMLLGMLSGSSDGGEDGDESEPVALYKKSNSTIVYLSEVNEDEVEETANDLRQLITDKLMGAIEGATDTIAMVIQYISYLVLFTFFTWAYLIIKILAKMFMKNPAIKLGLPIWLGSLPYVILSLVPSIAFSTLQNPPAALADILNGMDMTMLNDLSINFFSCACVSFFVGIAFMLFVIFYYGKLRKRMKMIAKGKIVESPIEKAVKMPKAAPAVTHTSTPATIDKEPFAPTQDLDEANEPDFNSLDANLELDDENE